MLKHQSHWSGHCDSSLSTGLLHSILLSCTLNSGLAVSTESTRVLIWQPFGYVRPRDLSSTTYSNPPPTATKNSPGEKCYYEKEWLLCDSHCFIKKIFFFLRPKIFILPSPFSELTVTHPSWFCLDGVFSYKPSLSLTKIPLCSSGVQSGFPDNRIHHTSVIARFLVWLCNYALSSFKNRYHDFILALFSLEE